MALQIRNSLLLTLFLAFVPAAWALDPDVTWTFGNVGSASYRLDTFSPPDSNLGTIGAQNPTLHLELGKRYQVKVTQYIVHPLEIMAKSSVPEQDQVLLSMGAFKGPFEGDPEVDWLDNGQGTVTFTMTRALYDAMWVGGRNPGYRCQAHIFTMRGDFDVTGLPVAAQIRPFATPIDLKTIAVGLASPVDLKPDPVNPDILYVVDQAGFIRVIDKDKLQSQPFLDVGDRLVSLGISGTHDENDYDERGLLGLAFHPGYGDPNSPGYHTFYTYTSQPVDGPGDFSVGLSPEELNNQTVVTEWKVTNGQVDPNSAREVVRFDEPQFNHEGGMLDFGPDGYLYVALGDGGAANDQGPGHGDSGNGQNINTALGSILRIDPIDPALTPDSRNAVSANGAYRIPWDNEFVGIDGIDEIYAYGMRNPYRFSFDRLSGVLIAADVGQANVEEIDIVVKGGNYGWHLKEGSFLFDPNGVLIGEPFNDPGLIDPVAEYDHEDGISIIGGYMYYGSAIPELRARYVFADFSHGFSSPSGRLLVADLYSGEIDSLSITPNANPLGYYVKGMGMDQQGEIYVLVTSALGPFGSSGRVLKIIPFDDSVPRR